MKKTRIRLVFATACLSLVPLLGGCANDDGQGGFVAGLPLTQMSYGLEDADVDDCSNWADVSADGRFVAFQSRARNLVASDTTPTDVRNTYVLDRMTGAIECVTLTPEGAFTTDDHCAKQPTISDDGRYVSFWGGRNDLVPDDTNEASDCFVFDRVTRVTRRVSVSSSGEQAVGGHCSGCSKHARISGSGRYVVFKSCASNLSATPDTNEMSDVFVHDLQNGTTERVSLDAAGNQTDNANGTCVEHPDISDDGRFVAWSTYAENLHPDDLADELHVKEVFVKDRATGEVVRGSATWDGKEPNDEAVHPSLSGNGRFVAFVTAASNMLATDASEIPLGGDELVGAAAGVATYKRVFVRDLVTGELVCVTRGHDGSLPDNCSGWPRMSKTGRYVTFQSSASNLLPEGQDGNGQVDVFVYDLVEGRLARANVSPEGVEADGKTSHPAIAGNGSYVVFGSQATSWGTGLATGRNRIYAVTNPLR